ncbi:MAG: phage tail protein [Candidatus Nanopelagicales bacterium]
MFTGSGPLAKSYLPADGRIMSLTNNQVLYTILGSRFGGDGKNTFVLPQVANWGDAKWGICIEGTFPSRP